MRMTTCHLFSLLLLLSFKPEMTSQENCYGLGTVSEDVHGFRTRVLHCRSGGWKQAFQRYLSTRVPLRQESWRPYHDPEPLERGVLPQGIHMEDIYKL